MGWAGHADVPVLFMKSNRGRIHQLFKNPYHREVSPASASPPFPLPHPHPTPLTDDPPHVAWRRRQRLMELGITPETAVSCAFDFLFRPNKQLRVRTLPRPVALTTSECAISCGMCDPWSVHGYVHGSSDQAEFSSEFNALKQQQQPPQSALTIGIQIRTGDHVAFGQQGGKAVVPQLSQFQHFFDCAEQLEAALLPSLPPSASWPKVRGAAPPPPPALPSCDHPVLVRQVTWYFISDSTALREQAVARYGPEKVSGLPQPALVTCHAIWPPPHHAVPSC